MIDAVIFDFDGLILETETPVWQACREVYQEHGHDLPMERWVSVLGIPAHKSDIIGELERLAGVTIDREASRLQRRDRVRQLLEGAQPLPGVTQWLNDARQRGLRLAVASGSDRQWVTGHLRDLGLLGGFDVVVTSEDTEQHKPHPAPFLEACRRLGVEPGQAIALEDSPNGVRSARAAGLWTIAVPTAMTSAQAFAEAHLRIASLAETSLDAVIAHLRERQRG